jgi:hypothetical protein
VTALAQFDALVARFASQPSSDAGADGLLQSAKFAHKSAVNRETQRGARGIGAGARGRTPQLFTSRRIDARAIAAGLTEGAGVGVTNASVGSCRGRRARTVRPASKPFLPERSPLAPRPALLRLRC